MLRTEINDARSQLISRDKLIKELQEQLTDPQRKFILKKEINVSFRNQIFEFNK